MRLLHQGDIAKCGSYIKEIAATKARMVHAMAEQAGFPLLCTMREE